MVAPSQIVNTLTIINYVMEQQQQNAWNSTVFPYKYTDFDILGCAAGGREAHFGRRGAARSRFWDEARIGDSL